MKTATGTKFKETEIGLIPEGWGFGLLKNYCDEIQYGFTQSASIQEVGPKFLRITDIQGTHIDWDSVPFCKVSLEEHRKYKLRPNDIVIARTGASTGVNTIYKQGMPDSVFASYLIRIKTANNLNSVFTYYFLQSDFYKDYVAGILGGSAQPNANAQQLTEVKLPVPKIDEQKQIAEILSSLDDKIELNRKINANLEKLAAALFKKWFVDTRLRRDFGGQIGDELPEGWRMGKLGEEFEIIMGQSPSGDTYNEKGDGLPFYQGRTDFGFRFPGKRIYCTDPKRKARALDTMISVRAPVGDVNLTHEECCIGRGVGAIRKDSFSSYTFYTIKSLQNEISKFDSEGTVFGSINKDSLSNIPCVVPPRSMVDDFEKIATEIDEQILNLSQEIKNLISLRDSLLSRLMSGKIRVKV